jgi:hypothetical protein
VDKDLRISLRTVVAACRQVLEEDVHRQLEGTYGVTPRGEFIAREDVEPYAVDVREWRRERDEILAAIAHIESYGADRGHAVEQFVRESAFTVLNRLAALKLMEHSSRGLIPESVGRGKDSKGFALFQKISPEVCRAARNGPVLDSGFRLFLESIYDDLAEELGVLFDRRLPQSIIFPSDACLKRVLELLNQADVATVWSEDETIGWIYQYFIPKELRDEARKASQAPRNSYELAFRNQFFTPRYVVEFLVDNTLGRIWYEMRRGKTQLVDACKYLVRGAGDAFLDPGVTPAADARAASIEAAFRGPTSLPHRPKKDPRDLRLLDPACGSGHFLLYAYDLLEAIYVEAWDDLDGPPCEETGRRLRDDYPDREILKRAIPELIVGHNLHGIDIDLRATQIAALAMWLRAQRSYQEQGFKVSGRPRITRSNIVCAEPMPGERELLEEFVATIQPKLLGQLVRVVFDKMALAGEAGSLLPIEEEIRGAVAEAKRQWQAGPQPEQLMLFPVAQRRSEQLALFDVRGITDESFWHEAEGRVVESLREYARKAANGRSYRRRLFVEDATQGFAFIDIARKRFDVVLMNPPFGDASLPSLELLDDQLARCGRDIGPAFVAAAGERWAPEGYVGVLLSTAPLFQPSASRWRGDHLLGDRRSLAMAAHLGGDVLDEATVSASALVTRPTVNRDCAIPFFRLIRTKEKGPALQACTVTIREGDVDRRVHVATAAGLARLSGGPLTYWISDGLRERLASLPKFEGAGGTVKQGTATADEFRFTRAWWEVAPEAVNGKWIPFTKSSEYSPFWDDPTWLINFANAGEEIRATGKARVQGTEYFGKPGVTFPSRSVLGFNPRVHPSGSAFSHTGAVAFGAANTPATLLGYLASRPVEYVLSLFVGSLQGEAGFHPNHYEVGLVARLPWPGLTDEKARALADAAQEATRCALGLFEADETSHHFVAAAGLGEASLEAAARAWRTREVDAIRRIDAARISTDPTVADALGFSPRDTEEMNAEFEARVAPASGRWRPYFAANPDALDAREAAETLISYAVGVAFGRWDVRLALEGSLAPDATDAFDVLPVCPPGMLVGPDGLPARSGAISSRDWLAARRNPRELPPDGSVRQPVIHDDEYPVRVDWDGVLVDDPGHADDVVHRVRGVLELLFEARAGEIEAEACRVLGCKELRDYFRNPRAFFDDHIKRYSKSRRKAPIFWLLQSSKKAYGLWIYYPRLDRDTVFKALRNYVEPKIKGEATRLKDLKGRLEEGRETLSRRERSKLEKEIERQDALLGELGTFKESLERVSALGYEPDLDDGAVLNIAPFHELTPWKDARAYWKELLDGGYEWSTIAKRLRAREVAATPPGRSERHG